MVVVVVVKVKVKTEKIVEVEGEVEKSYLGLDEEWREDGLEWEFVLSWVWFAMRLELAKQVLFR